MSNFPSKIALGSANFGMEYGIANQVGKISENELEKIIMQAVAYGIEVIDTAQSYGDAEVRIGSLRSAERFNIITKIGVGIEKNYGPHAINALVSESCKRLNRSSLYGVMLHRPEVLVGRFGKSIGDELKEMKAKK